jgi:hypothetical protein
MPGVKRLVLAASVVCVMLVTFFHQGLTANPTSRLLTVWALVDDHTLSADRYSALTWDQSIVRGHVYSDKAPLASYLAVPFYAAYRAVIARGPQTPAHRQAANHIAIVVAAAVPFAVFVLLVLARLLRAGLLPSHAVWAAMLVGLGTFAFAYGCAFFGHMLAGALLVAAWVLALERNAPLAAGVCGGFAVLAEYPVALGVGAIAGVLWWERGRVGRFVVGCVPAAIALCAHNWAVTGAPWRLPYADVSSQWKAMQHGFGFAAPNWLAAWELVFSQYRGVLFYAPVVALFAPLVWTRFDGPERRRVALCALVVAYVALISAYFRWDGGWCTGPRHLLPVVLLVLYEGAAAWAKSARWRALFVALAVLGVVVNVTFAATDPIPSTAQPRPFMDVAFPALRDGHMNPHNVASEVFGVAARRRLLAYWSLLAFASIALTARAARRWCAAKSAR